MSLPGMLSNGGNSRTSPQKVHGGTSTGYSYSLSYTVTQPGYMAIYAHASHFFNYNDHSMHSEAHFYKNGAEITPNGITNHPPAYSAVSFIKCQKGDVLRVDCVAVDQFGPYMHCIEFYKI